MSRISSSEVRQMQADLVAQQGMGRKTPFALFWPERPVTFLEAYLTIVRNRRYEERYYSSNNNVELLKDRYLVAVDALARETRAADGEANWGHIPGFVRGALIWSASNPRALHQEQYGYVPEERLPHLFVKVNPDAKTAMVSGSNGQQNSISDWQKIEDKSYWSAIHGANNRYPCGGYYVILDALKGLYSIS